MIGVDTNLLVYAHRKEMPFHTRALRVLEELIRDPNAWAIPWPCVHEFIAVVTNARIFKTPTPLSTAFDAIRSWHQGGNLHFLSEGPDFLGILEAIAIPSKLGGSKIHDARIAALCIHHGLSEFWSCDRDFSLFPKLRVRNPLV